MATCGRTQRIHVWARADEKQRSTWRSTHPSLRHDVQIDVHFMGAGGEAHTKRAFEDMLWPVVTAQRQ